MMSVPTCAVILAGGLGTRLRDTVPEVPKPMAPVGGRPFLEHLMDYWIRQGITRFVLSVGYKHEHIRNHFGHRYQQAAVEYSVEETPLGTGGGIALAAEMLSDGGPFLVLNGDTYFAVDLPALVAFSSMQDADWTFSLFRSTDTARYLAMEVAEDGRIQSLKASEKQSVPLANGGVYLVHPRVLPMLRQHVGTTCSLEGDIFPAALGSGQRMFGLESFGQFIDIGVPHDYHRAGDVIF